MQVERTFTVSTPIEAAFAYLSDFENTEEWDPGTISTKRISGDGGLGTTYENVSSFMGREVELTYETVTYDKPSSFVCRGRNKTATATDHLSFTREGEGTRIHYRATFQFHGLVKLVAPLIVKPKLDSLADETVEQIKQTLQG